MLSDISLDVVAALLSMAFPRPRLTNIHHGYSFDVTISRCFNMDPGAYGGRFSAVFLFPLRRLVTFAAMPNKVAIAHSSRRVDQTKSSSPLPDEGDAILVKPV